MAIIFTVVIFLAMVALCFEQFHDFLGKFINPEKRMASQEKERRKRLDRARKTGEYTPPPPKSKIFFRIGAVVMAFWVAYTGLMFVHNTVIPLDMAFTIFDSYDSDEQTWEDNIEIGSAGDLGKQHEDWSEDKGLGFTHSRFWQEELWENWRFYLERGAFVGFLLLSFGWLVVNSIIKRFKVTDDSNAPTKEIRNRRSRKKRKRRNTATIAVPVLTQNSKKWPKITEGPNFRDP